MNRHDDTDDPAIREYAWACTSLGIIRDLPFPRLRSCLYSVMGHEDAVRIVTLGLMELPHEQIAVYHQRIVRA